jgi:hypothetical protein
MNTTQDSRSIHAEPVTFPYILNATICLTGEECKMMLVDKITVDGLRAMSEYMSEPLVKGVVDITKRSLVIDAGLHSDEELFLLQRGSRQADLWGINLWPELYGTEEFVEFDSMINIRPEQSNRSRGVEDYSIREMIRDIVAEKVDG